MTARVAVLLASSPARLLPQLLHPLRRPLARARCSLLSSSGRAHEELIHTLWGLGLLVGGFVLQAVGAILTMAR